MFASCIFCLLKKENKKQLNRRLINFGLLLLLLLFKIIAENYEFENTYA